MAGLMGGPGLPSEANWQLMYEKHFSRTIFCRMPQGIKSHANRKNLQTPAWRIAIVAKI
jgi:hypothetical protein